MVHVRAEGPDRVEANWITDGAAPTMLQTTIFTAMRAAKEWGP